MIYRGSPTFIHLTLALQNVPQAMVVLRDLLDLQCTTADLEKVPHLVYTIRKVSI